LHRLFIAISVIFLAGSATVIHSGTSDELSVSIQGLPDLKSCRPPSDSYENFLVSRIVTKRDLIKANFQPRTS
ncbi:MAG: hypothetical protein QOD84_2546, partial [Acidobacteriaceae bacterium]